MVCLGLCDGVGQKEACRKLAKSDPVNRLKQHADMNSDDTQYFQTILNSAGSSVDTEEVNGVLGMTASSELLKLEAEDSLIKNSSIFRLQARRIYKALRDAVEDALALSASSKTLGNMRPSPSFDATQTQVNSQQ